MWNKKKTKKKKAIGDDLIIVTWCTSALNLWGAMLVWDVWNTENLHKI